LILERIEFINYFEYFLYVAFIGDFAIEFDHRLRPQTFALEVELIAFFSFESRVHSHHLGLLFSWTRAAWRRQGKFPSPKDYQPTDRSPD